MSVERLGPYALEAVLGSGGMGTVYRARLTASRFGLAVDDVVALKVVHPVLLDSEVFRTRFEREARLGRQVTHPNVVRAYGVETFEEEGQRVLALVMELVEGQTLDALMAESGSVPESLGRTIARDLACGLAAIHAAGGVHRDLKPENVLITPAHEVKIMDLGVAHLQDEIVRLTQSQGFAGSVEYAAPEQFQGTRASPDGRSDLFSLGVLLYELTTGVHPFRGGDARALFRRILEERPRQAGELNPQISPFFEEVLSTLLEKDPDARFPSALSLLEVLDQGEAGSWWIERAGLLRRTKRRPLRRMRTPHETRTVGRDAELDLLRDAFSRAERGEGQVVLIRGEAGIGKSRLVEAFEARLAAGGPDHDFLVGSYAPGSVATVHGAFATAFRHHLGAEDVRSALRELFSPDWYLLPAFEALLLGEPLPTGVPSLSRDAMHMTFAAVTRKLSEERPLVLVIEDLHNAPEEGRVLFSAMAQAIENQRVVLVGSGRHQLSAAWIGEMRARPHVRQLELERLGRDDLHGLLTEALANPRLVRDLEPTIMLKSEGNPYFVFEILHGLRQKGRLARRPDGSWTSTGREDVVEVPSSLHELIRARLSHLTDEERELLEVASCCGFQFDPILVAEVAQSERIPALRTLARLERTHRLVRARGRSFIFDHHQVMEVLYAALSPLLREEYHGVIARELERRVGEDGSAGGVAVEICRHGLHALRSQYVRPHLAAALAHLEQRNRIAEAIALAQEALDLPDAYEGVERFELLVRLNANLALAGGREAQAAVLAEAETVARTLGDSQRKTRVVLARAHLVFDQGRLDEARRLFEAARAAARDLGVPAFEAQAEGGLGLVSYREARFEEAYRHFRRNELLAEAEGKTHAAASALGNQGVVLQALGRHEEALRCLERVQEAARELQDVRLEGKACDNRGILLQGLGRVEEARESYRRALGLAERVGDRMGQAVGRVNLGSILFEQDQFAEAQEHLEGALEISSEIRDPINQGIAFDNLGMLAMTLGDHETSRRRLEEALERFRSVGSKRDEAYVLENLGRLAEEEGRPVDAVALLEACLAMRREIDYPVGTASALGTLGRVIADDDPERARSLLDEAVEIAREHPAPTELLRARVQRAVLPGGRVEEGLEAYARMANEVPRTEAMRAAYLLWKATGDPVLLAEARRMLEERVARAPPERRAAMKERVALHRAICEGIGRSA